MRTENTTAGADGSVESSDLFCGFVSMLKSAYANKCDPESEKNCRWLIELPMTDEQVAIWDKVMNPPQNAKDSREDGCNG